MKAISMHMPWALWVTIKWKGIETRTHNKFKNLKGERIAIHATQQLYETEFYNEYFRQRINKKDNLIQISNQMYMANMHRGMIMCTAVVKEARWAPNVRFKEREDWSRMAMIDVAGKFCLFLEDVKPLKKQIPYTGQQGIFNIPDSLVEEAA